MSSCRKGFITITSLVAFMLALPFGSTLFIQNRTLDQIHTETATLTEKEAAVVLGAAAYPSRLSDVLQDRVDTAIEAYQAGKVEKLYMSGAENEAPAMAEYAVEHGVPAEDIVEDPNGFNTLASIQNAAKEFESVLVVTQAFHLPRGVFYAKYYGLDPEGLTADKRDYLHIYRYQKRELIANSKAFFDVFFGTANLNIFVKDL